MSTEEIITEEITTNDVAAARTSTFIAYGLMLLSIALGITSIVGLIWAYVKRSECEGTVYESHMKNIISTFWKAFIFIVIAIIINILSMFNSWFFVGTAILIVTSIYWIFKMVKGFAKAHSGKEY